MKRLLVILMALLLGGILAPVAQASYSITFTLTPGYGVINYYPPDPCLVGSNLRSTAILGLGTPANSGNTYEPPDPCIVSFSTGSFTDFTGSQWLFLSGGSITGTVIDTTLLSGAFVDPSFSSDSTGTSHEFLGAFTAYLGSSLLGFYGITGNPEFQGLADIFAKTSGVFFPPDPCVTDAIVSGSLNLTPVPIPGSLFLIGTGLLGLAGSRRFRKG